MADSLGKNKRRRRSELPTKRHRDGKCMIPGERGLPRQPKHCLVPTMTLDTTKGRSKHEERTRTWENRQRAGGSQSSKSTLWGIAEVAHITVH